MRSMRRFSGVRGERRVEATAHALKASGCTILSAPDPSSAPFEFQVRSRDGESLELVCYAFLARADLSRSVKTHRVHVALGREAKGAERPYIDNARRRITLMYAWHEQEHLFLAFDPAAHSPMRVPCSMTISDANLAAAKRLGWFGWERERNRLRKALPEESMTTESVLAFSPRNFFHYVRFEQLGTGLDAGPRSLLLDRLAP